MGQSLHADVAEGASALARVSWGDMGVWGAVVELGDFQGVSQTCSSDSLRHIIESQNVMGEQSL